MKPVLVIGSSNTDMVVKTPKLPQPGETVLGGSFLMTPGGKGANQAMAAQRLSKHGKVVFIAKVGKDMFGDQALKGFEEEGIDTRFVFRDAEATSGVALIGVDEQGENSIMVAPGANANLTTEEVSQALEAIGEIEWILLQLEIPIETVKYCILEAARRGIKVILNPAPAQRLDEEILRHLHVITPNEIEAELLTGIPITDDESVRKAAQILHEKGVKNIVITLGARGAFIFNEKIEHFFPAPEVAAIDTTAAGDVFNGALLASLSEQKSWQEALVFACHAAALSVTRMGAQASIPLRAEVEALLLKDRVP